MGKVLAFWKNWDENQKRSATRLLGLCFAALALTALISIVSYLFTWKVDQSLFSDPDMMSLDAGVSNAAGKFGFRLGHFLVCECFGLGSFALLIILAAISVRLLSSRWHLPLLKTVLVTLTGAFAASILLAYLGKLFGAQAVFGSGLGGQCGAFLVNWACNLFGLVPAGFFILLLVLCWFFCISKKFSERLGRRNELPSIEPDADIEEPALENTDEPEIESPLEESEDLVPVQEDAAPQEGDGGLEIIVDDTVSTKVKKPLPRYDCKEELPDYKFPPLTLLEDHSFGKQEVPKGELERNNNKIRAALANYHIKVEDVKVLVGPTVTLYKVFPAAGVRISEIKRLQEDIAMSLNAKGVRVVTLEDSVGIEVANDYPTTVPLKALLNDVAFRQTKAELPIAIGITITQKVKIFDLADAPHLLIAGATKQGKSVGLNVMVSSLLYSKHPSELKFVFIDPKRVEFSQYGQMLKHYLAVLPSAASEEDERQNAIVKKEKDAELVLRSLCIEMDDRYDLLNKAYVNNIKLYNSKYEERHLLPTDGHKFLPYIVVVIDEYADLTMAGNSPEGKACSKSIQNSIIRLAQKGRAAGIHVVLATQRPSVDVISGVIKANFPTRIAFRVTSRVDSTTILDSPGADKLIGKGDMLYYSGIEMERVQCAFISNDEIQKLTSFVGSQTGYRKSFNVPYYLPDPAPEGEGGSGLTDMSDLDERFEEAARQVVLSQRGSTSDLQRKLGMGYAKAGRVMDQLEAAGIVGPQQGSKPREVLVQDFAELEKILKAYIK